MPDNERRSMITITDSAMDAIKEAVADRGDSPSVRIYVAGYG
jgi:Fe-S cluster assembly iron-binding protein IscA